MDQSVNFVDYAESVSVKVGNWLLERGYKLASITGIAMGSPVKMDHLGILSSELVTLPRTYLLGFIKKPGRRRFYGTLFFENHARSAYEKMWVFEFSGRENVQKIRNLAEEMAKIFEVHIDVRLVSEQSENETFLSDYDY